MRPGKPFFSGRPRPRPGPGEEDERLINRFVSAELWKQEQAHFGSSKQVGRKRSCMFEGFATFYPDTSQRLAQVFTTLKVFYILTLQQQKSMFSLRIFLLNQISKKQCIFVKMNHTAASCPIT